MKNLGVTGAVTALANILSEGLSVEEITLLAGLFVQLGDTLATIAALGGPDGGQTEAEEQPNKLKQSRKIGEFS